MAEPCGVSKSQISREFLEANARQLEELHSRRLENLDIVIVSLDGVVFGDHRVIGVIGVDTQGRQHVLGVSEGATENKVVVTQLMESLVEHGLDPGTGRVTHWQSGEMMLRWAAAALLETEKTGSMTDSMGRCSQSDILCA